MVIDHVNGSASTSRLEEVLAAYLQAEEAGETPNREQWLSRYPHLSADLRAFFENRERVPKLYPQAPTFHAPQQFGDYELQEEIGRGGMGVVYKARQLSLNRTVAVKLILAGKLASMADVQRFRAEAEAAASLDHPHIVPVYDVGDVDGQLYFTMKLVEVGGVASAAGSQNSSNGQGDPRQAAQLLMTVARAVHYAHQRGLLHRDLKPSNLLIDLQGRPFVTDFGLAKRVESASRTALEDATPDGAIIGTPGYMAPEQAAGQKNLTTAVDVYSLGAILYELLAGRPPFRAGTLLETLVAIRECEPVRPGALRPRLDRDLETICLKCLEKDPQRRYGSAGVLADDLERWLAGAPIQARPVGRPERAWRWCRRNPARAAASVLAVVSLAAVTALAIGSAFAVELAEEQDRTKDALKEAEAQRAVASQQRDRAEDYLRQTERLATTLAMERGLVLCEQGQAAHGMLWLARSLEMAPAHAADLQRASRASLAGWSHQVHALRRVLPQKGQVSRAAFSPDGKTIVTGTGDGIAQLWDAATGKPRGVPFFEQKDTAISEVAFSPDGKIIMTRSGKELGGMELRLWEASTAKPIGTPILNVWTAAFSPDGKTLATTGKGNGEGNDGNNEARLWDASSTKPIGTSIPNVRAAAFSPDGKTFVTAGGDWIEGKLQGGVARIREVGTGKPIGPPMRLWDVGTDKPIGLLNGVAFSPNGKTIVTVGVSKVVGIGEARLWDVATGQPLGLPMQHQEGPVTKVAFNPDGKTLITGSGHFFGAGEARLWEAATGKSLGLPMAHEREVVDLAVSPDGKSVVTASTDGTARLWEAATGKPFGAILQHPSRVWAVAFSPDGKSVLTTSQVLTQPGAARLWEVGTGKLLGTPLPHASPVHAVAFTPDGKTVVTAGREGARLWETATGQPLGAPMRHGRAVHAVAFSPDGKSILTAGLPVKENPLETPGRGEAQLWSAATGQPFGSPMQHQGMLAAVTFSPDGKMVATLSYDLIKNGKGQARLWETATGKPLNLPLVDKEDVWAVSFSPDGMTILTAGDETTRVWETATGKLLLSLQDSGSSYAAVFSPDGKAILTGNGEGKAQLWEAATGKAVGPAMKHQGPIPGVAFSPDGRTLVTRSLDGTARLWEAGTGKPLGRPLTHQGQIHGVAFSPDGKAVATASLDRTARVWEAATGQPLGPPLQHQGPVRHVAFSPDGKTILTGSDDKTARLWQLPTPVQGDVERIILWTQVITGMELDRDDVVRVLDATTWHQRRQRLEELGGPPL